MALDVTNESIFVSAGAKENGSGSKESMLVEKTSLTEHLAPLPLSGLSDFAVDDNSKYPTGAGLGSGDPMGRGVGEQRNRPSSNIDNPLSESQIVISASGLTMEEVSLSDGRGVTPAIMSTPTRPRSPVAMALTTPVPQMTSTPVPLAAGAGKGPTGSNSKLGSTASHLSATTSMPNISNTPYRPQSLSVRLKPTHEHTGEAAGESSLNDDVTTSDLVNTSFTSQTSTHTTTHESQTDLDLHDQLQVPIIGYETMEERARFTVFKLRVHKSGDEAWHIFRRYSDFVRLNDVLKYAFPHFRLALPPKKWFGDNYERSFLDDRLLGLQAFLNNIISHRDVCNSEHVREFLCIDDPPGAHDSLEESRAVCELLEDQVYTLREDVATRDARITLLEEELSLYKADIENLRRALRVERALNTHRRHSPSSQHSEGSITEHDEACSEAEADQGRHKPSAANSIMTSPECASTSSWEVASENLKLARISNDKVTPAVVTSALVTSAVVTSVDVIATVTSSTVVPTLSVTSTPSVEPAIAPDMTSSVVPGMTSSVVPGMTSSVVPGMTSSVVPGMTSSVIPGMTSVTKDMMSVSMNGLNAVAVLTAEKTQSATVP